MKKTQLIRAACFLAVFFVALEALSRVLVYYDSDTKARFSGFYAEPRNSLDVVLIGSSPVHPYFAPGQAWEEYGFASHNLSTNAQPVDAIQYLVRDCLLSQRPSVIVVDLRIFPYASKEYLEDEARVRNVTDNLRPSLNRLQAVRAMAPEEGRSYYYFPIGKYHSRWKNGLTRADFRYVLRRRDPLRGYFAEGVVEPQARPAEVLDTAPLSEYGEAALRDLLTYCKGLDQEFLFVASPFAITEDDKRKENATGAIVREYGFDWINYNDHYDELEVDFHRDFYNGGHMNVYGSEKYTSALGGYLKDHYRLPDRRSDGRYAEDWNRAAEYTRRKRKAAILTQEKDFTNYLSLLDDPDYTVLMAVKDEALGSLTEEEAAGMHRLGLKEPLSGGLRSSYLAVISSGQVLLEQVDGGPLMQSALPAGRLTVDLASTGGTESPAASIKIGGMEYSRNIRGINIVVYSNYFDTVVDSVCFDMLSEGAAYR